MRKKLCALRRCLAEAEVEGLGSMRDRDEDGFNVVYVSCDGLPAVCLVVQPIDFSVAGNIHPNSAVGAYLRRGRQ